MFVNRARGQATKIVAFAPRVAPRSARSQWRRYYSSDNFQQAPEKPSTFPWFKITVGVLGITSAASVAYLIGRNKEEDVAPRKEPVDITFENSRTNGVLTKEEIRERLSSQHVQIKKSLENPGVYAWGSNKGRVVDPESKEAIIKAPQRISYFNGQLLRDLKLDENSGAAITEKGDLVQWGKGFSETEFKPSKTLTGKDLVSLCMSRDRIIALSSNGTVYSLPISKNDQKSGRKLQESSWLPFWAGGSARLSYRLLQPRLGLGEKVTAISGGQEHVLLLTSSGRVFSAASATEHYPSKGQLGIPGLTWATRPEGPVDACHEITELRGSKIVQIASGDYHSLALDKEGRVFVFGDNGFGQLGVEFDPAAPFNDKPTALPLQKLYGKKWLPKATSVAAGGLTSFFTVDAQRVLGPEEEQSEVRDLGRITADTWAFGKGIYGTLGNGRWTHLQDAPTKVKALSGLFEYDEKSKKISPIRLHRMSVGATHASAVLKNTTHLTVPKNASESETYYGSDALLWGGNEFWQIGTGRRNNVPVPTHIRPPADIENPDTDKEQRFQVVPHYKGKVGKRTVTMEQRIECGKHVSAVYSGV